MTSADITGTDRTFKTFSRKDPEFLNYLEGSFSHSHIALPLRSLNVGTLSEQVTFEVVPVESITRPAAVAIARALVRPSTLVFSLGPMLAVFARLRGGGVAINEWFAVLAFIGILAFHIALNLLNDYGDHIKGQDRVRPHGGSRAIQKGWIRALTVKKIGWGLMGFAILCSVPSVIASPVIIIAGIALLVALEFAFQKLRLKARGLAEILAFALAGPLLTLGYSWAITGAIDWRCGALGLIFGSIALMYFHAANFENIMPDSQAGASTWATRAGFDASKTFFVFTAGVTLATTAAFVFGFEQNLKLLPALLAQVLLLIPVTMRVLNLQSPLASELRGLRNEPVRLSWLTTIALLGGFFWR